MPNTITMMAHVSRYFNVTSAEMLAMTTAELLAWYEMVGCLG